MDSTEDKDEGTSSNEEVHRMGVMQRAAKFGVPVMIKRPTVSANRKSVPDIQQNAPKVALKPVKSVPSIRASNEDQTSLYPKLPTKDPTVMPSMNTKTTHKWEGSEKAHDPDLELINAASVEDIKCVNRLLNNIGELQYQSVVTADEIAQQGNNLALQKLTKLLLQKKKEKMAFSYHLPQKHCEVTKKQAESKASLQTLLELFPNMSVQELHRQLEAADGDLNTATTLILNNQAQQDVQPENCQPKEEYQEDQDQSDEEEQHDYQEGTSVSLWNEGVLNTEILEHLLLRPDIANLPVVVLAVGGEFRTGKSFLLCYILRLLRYLDSRAEKKNQKITDDWLGDPDEPLQGFVHKRTMDPVTTGIDIWSEPFIVEKDGEKVAIILMDTQGIFDNMHSLEESYFIFAFSIMVSSVFVYNIPRQLNDHHHLDHLKMFTDYAKGWKTGSSPKDFQKLMFLVRDWDFTHEYDFGLEGGNRHIQDYLEIKNYHVGQSADLRKYIRDTWEDIQCYLMPHPGFDATKGNYNGKLSGLRGEFRIHLKKIIEELLDPKKLVTKNVSGLTISAAHLYLHIKSCAKNIEDHATPPSADNLLKVTVTSICDHAKIIAYTKYQHTMVEYVKSAKTFWSDKELQNKSDRTFDNVMCQFEKATGSGIPTEFPDIVKEKREALKEECLANYQKCNELNNFKKGGLKEQMYRDEKGKLQEQRKIAEMKLKRSSSKTEEQENRKYLKNMEEEIRKIENAEKEAQLEKKQAEKKFSQAEKMAREPWWRSMANKVGGAIKKLF